MSSIYKDLSMDDLGYIKQQMVDLTLATFDKNPQDRKEWETIVSSTVGRVSVLGDDSVRVNLNKFGPDNISVTIDRISPTELDAHVVERIAGIDNQVL
jgi:hypothetical protein